MEQTVTSSCWVHLLAWLIHSCLQEAFAGFFPAMEGFLWRGLEREWEEEEKMSMRLPFREHLEELKAVLTFPRPPLCIQSLSSDEPDPIF